MSNLAVSFELLEGLSYSDSVNLPTCSKVSCSTSATTIQCTDQTNDKVNFQRKTKDKCPIHICLHWLSDNRAFTCYYPTDITKDIKSSNMNNILLRYAQFLLQKTIKIMKEQFHHIVKRIAKPGIVQRNKEIENFISRLNSNTNKPCCNSNVNKEELDGEFKETTKMLKRDLSRTFTQNYEMNLSSQEDSQDMENYTSSSTEMGSETFVIGKKGRRHRSASTNGTRQSEDDIAMSRHDLIPNLITNKRRSFIRKTSIDDINVHPGPLLYSHLQKLMRKHPSKLQRPKGYNICYTFYIYMYPSKVDSNLLLFQRHELINLSYYMDPFDLSQLISDTKADFLFDRRLKMIQNQCGCQIVLEPLTHIFINGLPHRLIKIFSSNYENVAKALSLLEDTMPELMKTSVFKYDLPVTYPCKWSPKNMIMRPIRTVGRPRSESVTWCQRINPHLRFSSLNLILSHRPKDIPMDENIKKTALNKDLKEMSDEKGSIKSWEKENNDSGNNFQSPLNVSNKFCEVINEKVEPQLLESDNKNSNIHITTNLLSTNSVKYHYLKRIKCPASILEKEIFSDKFALNFLFDKFSCNITKVDVQTTATNQMSSGTEQIKLTVIYNTKQDLQEFCRALGLCIKLK